MAARHALEQMGLLSGPPSTQWEIYVSASVVRSTLQKKKTSNLEYVSSICCSYADSKAVFLMLLLHQHNFEVILLPYMILFVVKIWSEI